MNNKIIILKPRLDIDFGYREEIPQERGKIPEIRVYWDRFVNKLSFDYRSEAMDVEVIERPLWQFNSQDILKLRYNKIFIPHHCRKTFDKDNQLINAFYYMQMVFPWLFQVDSIGWCADASVWPIKPSIKCDKKIFKKYQNLTTLGLSKFPQPKRNQFIPKNKYILFLCQLPYDQTIKLHSKISVIDALIKTIQISISLGIQLIIKPHPGNKDSMKPFLKTASKYNLTLNKNKILWAEFINIHDLLENCEAVFSVNSGGGMEAILHNKPVFCFGKSDYASVSHYVDDSINWNDKDKYISHYPNFLDAYVKSMVDVSGNNLN